MVSWWLTQVTSDRPDPQSVRYADVAPCAERSLWKSTVDCALRVPDSSSNTSCFSVRSMNLLGPTGGPTQEHHASGSRYHTADTDGTNKMKSRSTPNVAYITNSLKIAEDFFDSIAGGYTRLDINTSETLFSVSIHVKQSRSDPEIFEGSGEDLDFRKKVR